MTEFKHINGKLCRVVEPTPLQPDSPMPCVVRLIQDDSPMGKYNQSYSEYRYGVALGCCMLPIIATHIAKSGIVNDVEWDVNRYEIIGYPVVDGSAEWALWQMQQGKIVSNNSFIEPLKLYQYTIYTIGGKVYCSANEFVDTVAHKSGWQLYTEPKPLLADAKVGDLCKRRDGKWVQIDAIRNNGNKWSIYEAEGHSYHESGNSVCSELYHTNLDIIHTEPLAPKGTKDWAWQMLVLGKKIARTSWRSGCYYVIHNGFVCHVHDSNMSDFLQYDPGWWKARAAEVGKVWIIYKEQPEPSFKVGDWVTDGVVVGHIAVINDGKAWVKTQAAQYHLSLEYLRKFDPFDVKVDFGTFKGRVYMPDGEWGFAVLDSHNDWIAQIDPDALDAPTLSFVERLLKAQEAK